MSKMMIEFDMDNAALEDQAAAELRQIFDVIASKYGSGADSARIRDTNGNTIGKWEVRAGGPDAHKRPWPVYANLWGRRVIALDERHAVWHYDHASAQQAAEDAQQATGVEHWPFKPQQRAGEHMYVVALGTERVRS